MGWLIAFAVIALFVCLPLGVSARFDEVGAMAQLIVGPLRFAIYPRKKGDTTKQKTRKKRDQAGTKTRQNNQQNKGGKYSDFLPVLKIVLEFLEVFRRKLRVKRLELKLVLAGDDPCDLAVNYGKAWAILGNLMPQLERFLVIRKRDLSVECDFSSDQTLITARVDLTITVGRLLHIVILHGFRALYHYYKILNKRKGGAKI